MILAQFYAPRGGQDHSSGVEIRFEALYGDLGHAGDDGIKTRETED